MGRWKFVVWNFLYKNIVRKMPPAGVSYHGSNYASNVLTNFDSDIFNPSASTIEVFEHLNSSFRTGLLTNNGLKLGG